MTCPANACNIRNRRAVCEETAVDQAGCPTPIWFWVGVALILLGKK